jgi:single-stranded-DNA-specific exonuclease
MQLRTAPLVAQILHNRGLDDFELARSFMNPKLTDLHDPSLLPGIDAAARRIARAIADHEPIVIYGDYDVDGITGVAILRTCLEMLGAKVDYYVPHRLESRWIAVSARPSPSPRRRPTGPR